MIKIEVYELVQKLYSLKKEKSAKHSLPKNLLTILLVGAGVEIQSIQIGKKFPEMKVSPNHICTQHCPTAIPNSDLYSCLAQFHGLLLIFTVFLNRLTYFVY
jgi:hypothetical protein